MRQSNVATKFSVGKKRKLNFFVFGVLNNTKYDNHSVNKIYINSDGLIIVARCNCGKGIYHPVKDNQVLWKYKISGNHIPILQKFGVDKGLQILEE